MPASERSPEFAELVLTCVLARRAAGLSQRQLAARSGVGQRQLCSFERMDRAPTLDTLIRLVAAYGFRLTLEEIQ